MADAWRWRAGVALATALAAGLALYGFDWGLPSAERNALYFTSGLTPDRIPRLSEDELGGAWRDYPIALPGAAERAGAYGRSAFNPIRSYHPDEYVILKSLAGMRPEQLEVFPGFFSWPAAYFYEVGAALGAAHVLGAVELRRDLGYYFEHPEAMARLYLVGRTVTLLFALGCVVALAAAARRLYGTAAGIAAAFTLAALPMFIANARYMTADISMLFWVCLAFYFAIRLAETPRLKWYLLCGAAVGLAAATRYQGALAALAPIAAHLLSRRARSRAAKFFWLILGGALAAAVFLLLNPRVVLRTSQFARELGEEVSGGSSQDIGRMLFYPWAGLTLAVSLLALKGLMVFVKRRTQADLLALGAFLPAALLLLAMRPTMLRYLLPALPLAPLALAGLWSHWQSSWKRWLAAGGITLAAVATLCWSHLYATADPRMDAGRYIAENFPTGTRLGVLATPWQFDLPPLDEKRYQIVVLDDEKADAPWTFADCIVASDFQWPPLSLDGKRPKAAQGLFRGRIFDAPWRGLGIWRKSFAIHDVRYVNPMMVVVEARNVYQ